MATEPLLWYPLAALKKATVEGVILVRRPSPSNPLALSSSRSYTEGSAVSHVRSWLVKEHNALPSCEVMPPAWNVLKVVDQVATVEDDATMAPALRRCLPLISCPMVLVMRLGAVTDFSLRADSLLSVYSIDGYAAVVALLKQKTKTAAQTKAVKIPKV